MGIEQRCKLARRRQITALQSIREAIEAKRQIADHIANHNILNGLYPSKKQQQIITVGTDGECTVATPEDIQRRISYQLEKSLTEDRDPAWRRYRQKHQDEIAKEIMDKPRKKASEALPELTLGASAQTGLRSAKP